MMGYIFIWILKTDFLYILNTINKNIKLKINMNKTLSEQQKQREIKNIIKQWDNIKKARTQSERQEALKRLNNKK